MVPSSMERAEVLGVLLSPSNQAAVTAMLVSSDVHIAVPCSVLSQGGSQGAGSRIVPRVLRAQGASLALDCGQWWRGAPHAAVLMDYRQV